MTRAFALTLIAVMLAPVACIEEDKTAALDTEALVVDDLGAADLAWTPLQGELGLDDRQTAALTAAGPYHYWDLELADERSVFIDLASREGGDTYLLVYRLQGRRYRLFDYNDDCRGSLNSCVTAVLPAGLYRLVATSYAYMARGRGAAFAYEIEVMCDAEDGCGEVSGEQACGSRGLGPCPEGTYCDWNATATQACGATDAPGVCQPRPEACITLYDPVCGCDGRTYGNACSAASNGIDVASEGSCPGQGQGIGETCAGIAALQCAEGLECDFSGNVGCFIADMGGACYDPTVLIACTREYRPVCGCDGRTYGNDCERRAAHVAFDHDGVCAR